jgi:hydrophobe/amphiphile efflux-3 (HAE3) family protein
VKAPFEVIAAVINAHPGLVIVALAGAIVLALAGTTFISMATGTETYLDRDTPRGILLEKYTDTFQSDAIMVLIEADDVLNPSILAYIDRLQNELRTEAHVTSVSSIADMVRQLNGGVLPTSIAEVDAAKALVPAATLERYLPSKTMTISLVTLDPGLSEDAQYSVLDSVRERIRLSERPPGITVTVTGNAAFNQEMGEEMGSSMGALIGAAMVLMIIAVGLLFGHVRHRFLSVGIVATGLILTFGIVGWASLQINMATIAAFPVLIGIGIDYAIQFHSRFDEESRRTSLPEAVRLTVTRSGPSILYAMLATSIGFIALWVSPLPMIRSFGVVCTIGVMACYLVALVSVPAVGLLTSYRPKAIAHGTTRTGNEKPTVEETYNNLLGRVASKVAHHPVSVLVLVGLVALIGFQLDTEIPISTDEDTFVPKDMPALVNLQKVSRTMGSTSSTPIYVRGDRVLSPEGIRWMLEFQEYELTHNEKMLGAQSIATLIVQANGGRVPTTQTELTALLAQIPEATKRQYISGSTEAVIAFSTVEMTSNEGQSMIEELRKELTWIAPPPGIVATVTGQGEMFTNLIQEIERGKLTMTLLAFGMIFGFLLLVYRRVGKAITPLVPIAFIVGWNGLIMYVLGIDYTPLTAVLGSMSIGVASEYTIVMMERCYEEWDEGYSLFAGIIHSIRQIGTAISVSGLCTVFGFSALILSTFNIVSNFGVVTVITVAFSILGAITVMPAVLSLVGGRGRYAVARDDRAEPA